jgi:hypothetical protein
MNNSKKRTYQGDVGRGVVEQLHGVAVQRLLIGVCEDLRQSSGHHGAQCEHCSLTEGWEG